MKINQIIYDCRTKQARIEEIEIEDIIEEIPVIPQETSLEERVTELEKVNQEQDELINTTMLATDEMFMMLEPLLAEVVNLDGKRVNPLLNMYVAMIERGIKTIEQVPARYREQVKELLEYNR